MRNYRFLFTGGGTGGHVYPNIAIYEALKEKYPEAEFLYIGNKKGAEAQIVPALSQPLEFTTVASRGLPQNFKSPKTLFSMFNIFLGAVKSFFILRRFKPDVIIGSGGYVAAPVLLTAALLKLKIFIHEQNAVPGRLNLFVARFADKIGISFPSSAYFFPTAKVVQAGYPLRKAILANNKENFRKKFNIPENSRVLFICSGSMGARTINRAVTEIMPRLLTLPNLFVILSTGKSYSKDYKAYDDTVKILEQKGIPAEIEGRLLVREYFDNIAEIYAMTDLVVSRAGAGAIKEITAMGLPAILIPKINLPADHQILNAIEIEKIGAARVLYEEISSQGKSGKIFIQPDLFFNTIQEILSADDQLAGMRKNLSQLEKQNSTENIITAVDAIIQKKDQNQEREIKIFYLQSVEEEKNIELFFNSTTVGNTFLADIKLENVLVRVLFEIKFLDHEDNRAIIKRLKGCVRLNDQEITGWQELNSDDRITVDGCNFIFKSYFEKIRDYDHEKAAAKKTPRASLGIMFSRLVGFGREVVSAAVFGAGKAMDIFSVGLTVANFMRRIVAENALAKAFLPIFQRLFQRSPRKKVWESASSIINFTLLLSLIFSVAGIVFAPYIIQYLFPGFSAKGFSPEAVQMTRIMFPYLFLVSLAAVMAIYLKAFKQFGSAESSTIFYSIGFILGILLLLPASGMFALAYGVLFGGLLQVLFLLPFLLKIFRQPGLEFSYRPVIKIKNSANRKYCSQLTPISLDAFPAQIATVVDKFLASSLRIGSLSYLYYAMEIFRLPFAIISRAISGVVMKEFSESTALFNQDKAKRLFIDGIRINLFLLAPISILMIALANPIVSLLLERMNFSAQDVTNTALALQFYAIGLIGWGVHTLTARIFSARLDSKTSIFLNFSMLIFNILLVINLVRTPLKFAGIALATSLSYLTFAMVRIIVLKRQLSRDGNAVKYQEIISAAGKTLSACLFMVIAIIEAKFVFNRIHFNSQAIENIILCVSLTFIGTAIYFLSSLVFKNSGILIFKKNGGAGRSNIPISLLSPFKFLDVVAGNPDFYKNEYRYKINIYLSSPDWEIKNVGIKLIGLFKEKNKSAYLSEMLFLGKGNGFMRRNALLALKALNIWNPEIKGLLLRLLKDGYFEVRVAALDYLGKHINESEYADLKNAIHKKLHYGKIEEKLACLRLIARKGDSGDLSELGRLYLDSNSLIREELLEVLYAFYRRNVLNSEAIKNQVKQVLITSNHLAPEFRIKSIINRIYREIETP